MDWHIIKTAKTLDLNKHLQGVTYIVLPTDSEETTTVAIYDARERINSLWSWLDKVGYQPDIYDLENAS